MEAQKYINSQHPKPEMPSILLVQDAVMCYLKPFLTRISEIHDIKFIFRHMQFINRYGIETSGVTNGVEGMK